MDTERLPDEALDNAEVGLIETISFDGGILAMAYEHGVLRAFWKEARVISFSQYGEAALDSLRNAVETTENLLDRGPNG